MPRVAWRNLSFWKKIGSNVKNVRKWRGLTDLEVSEKTGIDLKRYRKIERGQTESVTLEEVVILVNLFEVYQGEILPDITG
ncbi:MAG: helix-turn-helix transcriptional regulator [Patescibacteria group bacterium]